MTFILPRDETTALSELSPGKRKLLELRLKKAAAPAIKRRSSSGPAPLSFSQQRMWLTQQLEPDSPVANRPAHLRLRGELDPSILRKCFSEILRRHEVLRAIFIESGGEVKQEFRAGFDLEIPFTDLSHLQSDQRNSSVDLLAKRHAGARFNLESGPLLRAHLVRLDPREHVLLLTVHHIAFDAWSMRVLIRELSTLYRAFIAGKASPLPELQIQYADFAIWQQDVTHETRIAAQLEYWKAKLSGPLTILELPTDHARPAIPSSRGGRISRALPPPVAEALRKIAAEESATLFMAVLAAFNVLLYRYTGQEDIIVGSPIAGRSSAEVEGLIGCFINMLALRTSLSGDPSFRQLLRQTRETALHAYANQDVPIDLLVRTLRPQRDASRLPLFQVSFNYRNVPKDKSTAKEPPCDRLIVEDLGAHLGVSLLDLSLELAETSEGLEFTFEYDADLFESSTIGRMLGHFQTLIEGIAADPSQPISQISMLDAVERKKVLFDWNQTTREFPADRCLHELIEDHAARTPQAIAVRWNSQSLSYSELNDRANRLAGALRAAGGAHGDAIGLCIARSPDMIVAVLAILKLGAAYVPLDPAYPDERIDVIRAEARLSLIVTHTELREKFSKTSIPLVFADENFPQPQTSPARTGGPEDICYVIFTSGSTGRPKGVAIRHRSVVNFVSYSSKALELTAADSVLQFASISFDASVEEIFITLCSGATLVLRTDEMISSADEFLRQCLSLGITVLPLPTAFFHELAIALHEAKASFPASVRLVVIGGEALSPQRLVQWHKVVGPSVRLVNTYGPTETTIVATCCDCAGLVTSATPVVDRCPIGRPIGNVSTYVLDQHRNPVPIGVPGELYIGGEGLAAGYLNRPELTAERFIEHSFDLTGLQQIYRTGDLVRYLADGNLEFLGRVDNQMKIRGFRIELGEIEIALRTHPDVREAAVIAWDVAGDKRLAAYVSANSPVPSLADVLRNFLQQRLPSYMVPAAFVVLQQMPTTINGKLDRKSLIQPQWARHALNDKVADERDTTDETVAAIWAEILGLQHVEACDNFFDLGGHSLLAARLLGVVNEIFKVKLPLSLLFRGPTVDDMARALRDSQRSAKGSPLICVRKGDRLPPFFFLHGDVDTSGLYCNNLVRYLDPGQPFYVLHPPGVEGTPFLDSVESLAKYQLRLIRQAYPHGPYFLGGFCNGGIIACEIARRLREQGEVVHKVIMVAAANERIKPNPLHRMICAMGEMIGVPGHRRMACALWVESQILLWNRPVEGGRWKRAQAFGREIIAAFRRFSARLRRSHNVCLAPSRGTMSARESSAPRVRTDNLYRHLLLIMKAHWPRTYSGKVLLLWPDGKIARYRRDSTLGWGRVIRQLEVRIIPGQHTTCLTTHAKDLARQFRDALEITTPECE